MPDEDGLLTQDEIDKTLEQGKYSKSPKPEEAHADEQISSVVRCCSTCINFKYDVEYKVLGSCNSDEFSNHVIFGHADYVLISEDFSCKFYCKK